MLHSKPSPRTITSRLKQWKQQKRRKPLLLISNTAEGVVKVIVDFQSSHFEDMVVLDLDDIKEHFISIEEPNDVLDKLRLISGKKIDRERTLVVLKNVNDSNMVIHLSSLLNQFHRKYSVIFTTDQYGLLNQIEEMEHVQIELIRSVSFEEYLKLCSQRCTATFKHFVNKEEHLIPMKPIFYDSMLDRFLEFVILGGSSTSVNTYLRNKDLSEITALQGNLLSDFRNKILVNNHSVEGLKMNMIFSLNLQYKSHYKKFKCNAVREPARARTWESSVNKLISGGYLNRVTTLGGGFKLFHINTGFLISQLNIDTLTMIRERQIPDPVMETFVVNSLLDGGDSELELVITKTKNLQPYIWTVAGKRFGVFVGGRYRKRFIQNLIKKHNLDIGIKIGQQNFSIEDNIVSIPIFFADHIMKFISKIEKHGNYIPDFKKKYSIY